MATWFLSAREPASPTHRVSTFELLFDLVFVFAFTQVTEFMATSHSATGVLEAMIMLGFLWWSWSSYGWLTNQSSVDDGVLRVGMIVGMCAIFVLALAIPAAFSRPVGSLNAALVIGIAYFVVRVVHFGLYLLASGSDRDLRIQVLRTSISMWVGVALILTGAILGPPAQLWFWLAAMIADIGLTYATSRGGNWRVHSASHWAERHGLVVILALGESVVAIGSGAAHSPLSLAVVIGAILALLLTTGLWWLYFDAASRAAEEKLESETGRDRSALATDAYTYLHLLLIAGIVISALGVEEIMARAGSSSPLGLFGGCALFGGTSLYLFGHAAFWKRVGDSWKVWRLAGATTLLALVPLSLITPPLAALGVVVAVTAIVVTIESALFAQERAEFRAREPA
ncbi:MAG TPA: low temperature requirement protein A [Galbitalea sp.]|jgi:low temperature requirement protein LtrA|nr:low temperature requirement protein A [Galbitalea sp.]